MSSSAHATCALHLTFRLGIFLNECFRVIDIPGVVGDGCLVDNEYRNGLSGVRELNRKV